MLTDSQQTFMDTLLPGVAKDIVLQAMLVRNAQADGLIGQTQHSALNGHHGHDTLRALAHVVDGAGA